MTNDIWAQLEEEGKIIKEQKEQIADLVAALKACMAEIQDVLDENPNSIHLGLLVDQAEQALGKEE